MDIIKEIKFIREKNKLYCYVIYEEGNAVRVKVSDYSKSILFDLITDMFIFGK